MSLEIEVQTGERFSSEATMHTLMVAIGGHQLLPAIDKNGEPVVLNTGSIVWIKER